MTNRRGRKERALARARSTTAWSRRSRRHLRRPLRSSSPPLARLAVGACGPRARLRCRGERRARLAERASRGHFHALARRSRRFLARQLRALRLARASAGLRPASFGFASSLTREGNRRASATTESSPSASRRAGRACGAPRPFRLSSLLLALLDGRRSNAQAQRQADRLPPPRAARQSVPILSSRTWLIPSAWRPARAENLSLQADLGKRRLPAEAARQKTFGWLAECPAHQVRISVL